MKPYIFLAACLISFTTQAQDTTKVTLLFTGDIMGHDSQIAAAYDPATGSYDYTSCFQFIKPYIESADVAIGNLELTLAGPPYKGYPQFSSPDVLAATLKDVGFDVLVTANNHSVDRGKKGIERTITTLDSIGIPHTGTFVGETDRLNNYPFIFEKNGFTMALLNYTYGTNGIPVPSPVIVNLIDTVQIGKDLARAKELYPDVIITFLHWGIEYERLPRKEQINVANFCFKHGADLVIGSHPHVIQPMEWKKNEDQFVVYSLGNFVSGQRKQYTDGGTMAYVGLQKIRYKPDSIVTTIDTTGFYLQWVYRTVDAKKDYYILPVPSFESDPTGFIKDDTSREAFKTFVRDSRDLYSKRNVNVNEIRQIPPDSIITYKVLVNYVMDEKLKSDTASWKVYPPVSSFVDTFYGYTLTMKEDNTMEIALGDFDHRATADRLCKQLLAEGKEATVVTYVNGEPETAEEK